MFVALDKLTPRDDSNSKMHQRYTDMWKEKNEQNCAQGDTEKLLKIGQRVVTILKNYRPVRGSVRYIGNDRDRNGKLRTVVGLELVS